MIENYPFNLIITVFRNIESIIWDHMASDDLNIEYYIGFVPHISFYLFLEEKKHEHA